MEDAREILLDTWSHEALVDTLAKVWGELTSEFGPGNISRGRVLSGVQCLRKLAHGETFGEHATAGDFLSNIKSQHADSGGPYMVLEDDRVPGLMARVKELEAQVENAKETASFWEEAGTKARGRAAELGDKCGALFTALTQARSDAYELREENERLKKKLEASRVYR